MNRFQRELYNAMLYSVASTLSKYDPASATVLSLEMGRKLRAYLEQRGYSIPRADNFTESVDNIVQLFVAQGDFEIIWREFGADGVAHSLTRHPTGVLPFALVSEEGGDVFKTSPIQLLIYNELERFNMVAETKRARYDLDKDEAESWTLFRPGHQAAGAPGEGVNLDVQHVIAVERERVRVLEELNREMARLHKLKAEVIAGVSHELKTPLHCILGYTELLAEGQLSPAAVTEYLDIIRFNGQQLLRLVNDVLDWSRLEVGYLELQYNVVPIQTLLERTARSLGPIAADRKVHLDVQVDPEELAVEGDPHRLLQVTTNLAVNAIKFSQPEGRVMLQARRQTGQDELPPDYRPPDEWLLRIDIVDDGLGIPLEDQERIFESFQQVRWPEGRSPGGSGLGLPIARRIVELHGGRLWVKSTPNHGSVFSLVIPHKPDAVGPGS